MDIDAQRRRQAAAASAAAASVADEGADGGDSQHPANANEVTARRRHRDDEPLQRPSTPRASGDYGAHAMAQSGALEGADGELPAEGDEGADGGGGGSRAPLPAVSYPDVDAVDISSPTIPVHNRLPRTPQQKFRPEPGQQALQPTASRARATVERVHRRPPGAPPGSVGKGTKPPAPAPAVAP